jgi:hypothetical protein
MQREAPRGRSSKGGHKRLHAGQVLDKSDAGFDFQQLRLPLLQLLLLLLLRRLCVSQTVLLQLLLPVMVCLEWRQHALLLHHTP